MSNTNRLYTLILCALFCALCAIGAFIKIPLAWMPITLQTFFSTLSGLLLGKKWGAVSIAVYLALGLIGIPLFTQGGGIGYVLKPTFGFLLGLLPATFVTGALYESSKKTWWSGFWASLVGALVIYLVGLPYFYGIMTLYMNQAMTLSQLFFVYCLPTIPGDIVKCIVCATVSIKLHAIVRQNLPV